MSAASPFAHRLLSALMAALIAGSTPLSVAAQGAEEAAPAAGAAPSLAESLSGAAKANYESGKLLFEDGDNEGAKLKFESAFETSKDPRLLWNIAACEKNLRNYTKVLDLLERYLASGDDKIGEEARARATELRKTVRTFVAEVEIRSAPEGAKVFVDGVEVGTTPLSAPLRVNQGSRGVRITKDGFAPWEKTLKINGGEAKSLSAKLQKEAVQARLRVSAGEGQKIVIDGRDVGSGEWEGFLKPGSHSVQVTAPGYEPYRSQFILEPRQTKVSRVRLEALPKESSNSLPWLIGGAAVLAAGLGVGAYFLFKKDDDKTVPEAPGTLSPGNVYLSF